MTPPNIHNVQETKGTVIQAITLLMDDQELTACQGLVNFWPLNELSLSSEVLKYTGIEISPQCSFSSVLQLW